MAYAFSMPAPTRTTLYQLIGKRFVGVTPSGTQVLIDGEADHRIGMGPMQLVLNAWGGCVAYEVVEMLRKRRVVVRSYRVELEGQREDGTPSFFTNLHARHVIDAPGLDQRTFERFVGLATTKYCSVGSSLKATQSYDVVLEHDPEGATDPA